MDPTVVAAAFAAGGAIAGGSLTATVSHVLGRRTRTAQDAHLTAQTDALRQDIYQQLTGDLRTELDRVQAALASTRTLLRTTSTEAEHLRARVVDLESRVAQLTRAEAQASQELERVQRERDQLRAELAAREATIVELRGQVADLRLQAALAQPPPAH